jgi:hypothetical protein
MQATTALAALLTAVLPITVRAMDDAPLSLLTAFEAGDANFFLNSAPPSPLPDELALSLAPYPRAGWQATLSTRAHGVRGTVTIVDADTFRVDDFFYDGGGIAVYFILAAADDNNLFRTERLVTERNFLGMPQNGGSVTVDLPAGTTFDGYNAISLWCLPAQANFGSGTFQQVPEPAGGALLALGALSLGSLARLRPARTPITPAPISS